MNDKIRQLAEQAEVYYNDSIYAEEDLAALQKFAELIINECVVIALDSNASGEGGVIAETIEKHFGVEE